MELDATWQSYFLWLKDRGQIWPLPGADISMSEVSDHELSDALSTIEGFGCELPELVFVGDAPMSQEEQTLMTAMIKAMGLDLSTQVFVADFLNGVSGWPTEAEVEHHRERLLLYLNAQQRLRCVVSLGVGGAKLLYGPDTEIPKIKSRWNDCKDLPQTPTFATYHPRDMIKRPASKRPAWEDLQKIMEFLNDA